MDTSKFEVLAGKGAQKGSLRMRCLKCKAESPFSWTPPEKPDMDEREAWMTKHAHESVS